MPKQGRRLVLSGFLCFGSSLGSTEEAPQCNKFVQRVPRRATEPSMLLTIVGRASHDKCPRPIRSIGQGIWILDLSPLLEKSKD
jgi:hypothetical protein